MNFWLVKWPKKAHHAESQNNVIFDVLLLLFFFTVGRNGALPSKTALRRDWETGFCVATAFFVKRIQRIRNCGWSSANTVVSWQRFVHIVGAYSLLPSRPGNVCSLFLENSSKLLFSGCTFKLGFHVIVRIVQNPSSFWGRFGRSGPKEWPTSIFS